MAEFLASAYLYRQDLWYPNGVDKKTELYEDKLLPLVWFDVDCLSNILKMPIRKIEDLVQIMNSPQLQKKREDMRKLLI